jgi:hypothetical protein
MIALESWKVLDQHRLDRRAVNTCSKSRCKHSERVWFALLNLNRIVCIVTIYLKKMTSSPSHCVQIQNGPKQSVRNPFHCLLGSWSCWSNIWGSLGLFTSLEESIGISNVFDNSVGSVICDTDWEADKTTDEAERKGDN